MKSFLFIALVTLVACAKPKDSGKDDCPEFSTTLFISNIDQTCVNKIDNLPTYKVIGIMGGDTSQSDTAFKSSLKQLLRQSKLRAEKVAFFSSPDGFASSIQYRLAQESITELFQDENIYIYTFDSYSVSLTKVQSVNAFVIQEMARLK